MTDADDWDNVWPLVDDFHQPPFRGAAQKLRQLSGQEKGESIAQSPLSSSALPEPAQSSEESPASLA